MGKAKVKEALAELEAKGVVKVELNDTELLEGLLKGLKKLSKKIGGIHEEV